ncbi:MAG: InlB B-repeat-containing protein [Treponema sp.]|nr:InlB B-repeat-containing protein [Treponema sp.]
MKQKRKILMGLLLSSLFIFSSCKNNEEKPEFFTVSFNTSGGSLIESVDVLKGETVEKPEDPTKAGYVFTRWNYNFEPFDFSTPIIQDITLDAFWSLANDVTYTIKIYVQNGNAYEDKTEDYTDLIGTKKGTTNSNINEYELAKEIEKSLTGYFFDLNNPDCSYEGKINADGSTTLKFYYSKVQPTPGALVSYTNPLLIEEGMSYNSNFSGDILTNSQYKRDDENTVLKLTLKDPGDTYTNRRVYFETVPEIKDWSSYDYIGFYVYNNTNSTMYARFGDYFRTEGLAPSCRIFKNQWNFITLDINQYKPGDIYNVYEKNNVEKYALEFEINNTQGDLAADSEIYVTNIKGFNYKNSHVDDNIIVRMDEAISPQQIVQFTERAMETTRFTSESVKYNNVDYDMVKFNVAFTVEDKYYHQVLFPSAVRNLEGYNGYYFDVYNPNDYSIEILGQEVPSKEMTKITAPFKEASYFYDDQLTIIPYDADGMYLTEGASLYIGNIYGNKKSENKVFYSVKVFIEETSDVYTEITSSFGGFPLSGEESIGEDIDLSDLASESAPAGYYFDAFANGCVYKYENVTTEHGDYELSIYYSKETSLLFTSNANIKFDTRIVHGEDDYSTIINSGGSDPKIYFSNELYESHKNEDTFTFFIYGSDNVAVHLITNDPWESLTIAQLTKNEWTEITITLEQMRLIVEEPDNHWIRISSWDGFSWRLSIIK